MKRLAQVPEIIMDEVRIIRTNDDMHNMGFACKGQLCKYEGYEDFYNHLWVWIRVEKDRFFTIITVDTGDSPVRFAYKDMYIKEVADEINKHN